MIEYRIIVQKVQIRRSFKTDDYSSATGKNIYYEYVNKYSYTLPPYQLKWICRVLQTGSDSVIFYTQNNSTPSGQNGRHFADDIFRWIFVNEKVCISIQNWLKCVPKGPIDKNPALV